MTVMFWGESNSGKEGWFDPLGSPLDLDKDDLEGAHWMPLPTPKDIAEGES